MKRIKILLTLLIVSIITSGALGYVVKSRQYSVGVPKGFAFGAPNSQASMDVEGMYSVTWHGMPAPYKVTETFRPTGDVFNALSYDEMPLNRGAIIMNFIFWMGLFAALLAPITIFYRPKKKPVEVKPIEEKVEPQVKADANPRD